MKNAVGYRIFSAIEYGLLKGDLAGWKSLKEDWYRAKNSKALPFWDLNCNRVSPDKVKATNSRRPHDRLTVWHRRPEDNGCNNSVPWNKCERKLVIWGHINIARNIATRNVEMFVVVGASPLHHFRALGNEIHWSSWV